MSQIIFFILNFLIIVLSLVLVANYASSIKSKMPIIHDGNLAIKTVYKGLRFPTTMAFLGPGDISHMQSNMGRRYHLKKQYYRLVTSFCYYQYASLVLLEVG